MSGQAVKDALADAETLRLNDSRYDWIREQPADGDAYFAVEAARIALYGVPELGTCEQHRPSLLEEGTFCGECGIWLPSYAAAVGLGVFSLGVDDPYASTRFRAVPGLRGEEGR